MKPFLCSAVSLLILFLSSCSGPSYRRASGVIWNTSYSVTYCADRDLSDSILATMHRVEASLSPFSPSSRISAINRGEHTQADSLILAVFTTSQRICQASSGRFDPTVGPLVEIWGFGTDKSVTDAPSDSAISAALALVGMQDCSIDSAMNIVKKHPATMFNFSAITKGLACDEVGRTLSRYGVNDYMVEIGGELALKGLNPEGKPWRIMVDAPVTGSLPGSKGVRIIEKTDCGIATSGNYRNRRATSHGSVGHTIDPLTGRPVARGILSATVIAPDCMTADALATACMVMRPDSARAMIESLPGIRAIFVLPPSK